MSGEWITSVDAYASGEMPDTEAEAFEARLFEAAATGSLGPYEDLIAGIRELHARGTLMPFVTRPQAEALLDRTELRVLWIDVGDGLDENVRVSADELDAVVLRFAIDLEGVTRLDAETWPRGHEDGPHKTMPDIVFDPGGGEVFACCEAGIFEGVSRTGGVMRFVAVEGGERRVVRSFTFPPPSP